MNRVLKTTDQINDTRVLRKIDNSQADDIEQRSGDQVVLDKEFLQSHFHEEIEIWKSQAVDKAYADTKEKIQNELLQKYELLTNELNEKYENKVKEAEAVIERFSSLIETALAGQKNLAASQQTVAIYLALEAIYRLLGEKETYQAVIVQSVKEQVTEFCGNSNVRVRVSPKDMEIEKMLPVELMQQIKIITDPMLQPGACEIEDGFSLIDVGVITRLDQMRETLTSTFVELNNARL